MSNNDKTSTEIRTVERTAPLHTGVVVYRVVEVDPAPDVYEKHTWKVSAVVVERASAKQIKLRSAFAGLSRTVFYPSAFGRIFFETPLQAIKFFIAERCLEIVALDRRKREAERALAWAQSQEGI